MVALDEYALAVARHVDDEDRRWSRHLRVYRAEDKGAALYPAPRLRPADVEEAQRYVDRIVDSAWWRDRCAHVGGLPILGVDVHVKRGGAGGYCRWELRPITWPTRGLAGQIRLSHLPLHGVIPSIADPWVILHELAHVMALAAGHRGHGGPFVYYFLALLRRWHCPEAAELLREACRVEGLRPRRPTLRA